MNSIAQSPNKINNEIWKDIPGYAGFYQVSNFGHVRGVDRILNHGRNWKGRVLIPKVDKKGYKHVLLYQQGKRKSVQIQILVMLAFVGPRPGNHDTHHKDNNPSNNSLTNLEYLSRKEHAKTKSKKNIRGSNSFHAVLSEKDVLEIRRLYSLRTPKGKKVHTQIEIAEMFNLCQAHVSQIILSKAWAWL
jgi:hypothetical protein